MIEETDQELTGKLGEFWNTLKQQNECYVARHTFVVLLLTLLEFEETSSFPAPQKNVLKWAALLHDICKLSLPAIKGKDHIHPFKSAAAVLDIFEGMNLIPNLDSEGHREKLQQIKDLLR